MSSVLQISKLSKKYRIYREESGNRTLAETLTHLPRKLFSRACSKKYEEFFALQEIDLEIEQGDQVGIIGRNGAGKSTLLKIISKITQPTSGSIKTNGRVASLLEVGTGFHLELTGRENIFLNGAILGLKRREIREKFDEIVGFAEIGPFLDTPVKRYSSGMLAKLGFAVAAHLDPDILIVDEVLAVGDKPFQEKCLKKLNEYGKEGRTVLFVSHDVGSVLSLCQKGIFLEKGRLKMFGPIHECVQMYRGSYAQGDGQWSGDCGDEHLRILQVTLDEEKKRDFFYQNEKIEVSVQLEVKKTHSDLFLGIGVWNKNNQLMASSYTCDGTEMHLPKGKSTLNFSLPAAQLYEGEYYLKIESGIDKVKVITSDEIVFPLSIYNQTKTTRMKGREGVFLGNHWEIHA